MLCGETVDGTPSGTLDAVPADRLAESPADSGKSPEDYADSKELTLGPPPFGLFKDLLSV